MTAPLSAKNNQERNEILANATPWQLAELIVHLAKNLEPFCKPDPFDNSKRLSEHPLFAELAKEPTTIKLYAIRALTNTLDRIHH